MTTWRTTTTEVINDFCSGKTLRKRSPRLQYIKTKFLKKRIKPWQYAAVLPLFNPLKRLTPYSVLDLNVSPCAWS